MIDLWLDDIRPAPPGWVHVKTVSEAKPYFERGEVRRASLDHDLGVCDVCRLAMAPLDNEVFIPPAGPYENIYENIPNCDHIGTGYTLVCWMEETGHWPREKPTVHSANPAGRQKMIAAINHAWKP